MTSVIEPTYGCVTRCIYLLVLYIVWQLSAIFIILKQINGKFSGWISYYITGSPER
jgi:hypothetical protein